VVFGTRPEAVKLAPVILELRARAADLAHTVVSTGQHREMLAPVLRSFGIVVDVELDLMAKADAKAGAGGATSQGGADRTEGEVGGGATLPRLAARILVSLDSVMRTSQPDVVVVQGDTSSALLGALSAFYWKVPVAHVEAGLRTGHRYNPFPEEMHRRLITALATLHFAPTSLNAWNVLGEMAPAAAAAAVLAGTKLREDDASRVLRWESGGVNSLLVDDRAGVQVVGSTAIDALHLIMNRTAHDSEAETAAAAAAAAAIEDAEARRGALLLVTAHRRENLGAPLRGICDAVLALVARYPGLVVAFPVHLAPAVQAVVRAKLTCQAEAPLGCDRIHLLPPLDHATLLRTMANSRLVLSDSGGLQEEAPALGVPLLVLRERTERVEGLHVGAAKLIGTQPERILREASLLLDSYGEEAGHYAEMAKVRYPYGDGTAAKAIVAALLARKSELIALKTASG
jgi:UDP-N-acetylglucosamine 2-epimerase (non-hydrolysing)